MPTPRSLFLTAAILAFPAALCAAGLEAAPDYISARQALADGLPGVAGVKAERLLKRKGWTRVETRQLATFAAEAWTRDEQGVRVLSLADAYDLDDADFCPSCAASQRDQREIIAGLKTVNVADIITELGTSSIPVTLVTSTSGFSSSPDRLYD